MAAVTIAAALVPRETPPRVWLIVAITAVVPDLDAIGRPFGRGDVELLGGHRAFTHSLVFAAAISLILVFAAFRSVSPLVLRVRLWFALFLALVSHGVLDALVTYGPGVQFLAPWSTQRYTAPWHILGGGIVRDTIAFLLCFFVARTVMKQRGFTLPRLLNPRFLQPAA